MDVRELQARFTAACALTQAVDRPTIVTCLRRFFATDTLPVVFLESSADLDLRAVRDAHVRTNIPRYKWLVAQTWDQTFIEIREQPEAALAWSTREAKATLAVRHTSGMLGVARAYAAGFRMSGKDLPYYAPILVGAAALGNALLFDRWLPLLEAFEAGAFAIYPLADRVCVATLPDTMRTDERKRLHCADGPAFVWRDNQQYYWHGVRVSANVILRPELITIEQIDSEKDLDKRGALWTATRGLWRTTARRESAATTHQPIAPLTAAQQALLPQYRATWQAIAMATDPADRPTAEHGVRLIYEAANLRPPKQIVWTPSPAANVEAYRQSFVRGIKRLRTVDDEQGDEVRRRLAFTTWDQVRDNVQRRLQSSPHWQQQLQNTVRESLNAHLDKRLRDVGRQILSRLRTQWGLVPSQFYGQHEADGLANYAFLREVCGLMEETEPIVGLMLIAQSANWWLPCADVCWISDRPHRMQFDMNDRLHCEDGMALEYLDGWGIYCWHGVAVPADVILHPETITLERINSEDNIEMRRVLLERFGEARYIEASGAKAIHEDTCGTLYRCPLPGDEPLVMVRVRNRTPNADGSYKHYWLRVPPTMQSAREAVAWTFGLMPEQYRPRFES